MTQNLFKKAVITAALGVAAVLPSTASAFLQNWGLNIDGTGAGGTTKINEFMDFVGVSYIRLFADPATTIPLPGGGTGTPFFFKDAAAFRVDTHDFGKSLGGSHFITTLFTGGVGAGVLGGGITFSAGGVLDVYSDTLNNFASTTGIYGANDGTLIGSFKQIAACQACFVDPTGLPTGAFAIFFEATSLASGYWFDALGNELQAGTVLGFATVNASYVANPPATAVSEIVGELSGNLGGFTNIPSRDFILSNNGQFRLDAIPEPGIAALLGLGLIGLGAVRSRRKS